MASDIYFIASSEDEVNAGSSERLKYQTAIDMYNANTYARQIFDNTGLKLQAIQDYALANSIELAARPRKNLKKVSAENTLLAIEMYNADAPAQEIWLQTSVTIRSLKLFAEDHNIKLIKHSYPKSIEPLNQILLTPDMMYNANFSDSMANDRYMADRSSEFNSSQNLSNISIKRKAGKTKQPSKPGLKERRTRGVYLYTAEYYSLGKAANAAGISTKTLKRALPVDKIRHKRKLTPLLKGRIVGLYTIEKLPPMEIAKLLSLDIHAVEKTLILQPDMKTVL